MVQCIQHCITLISILRKNMYPSNSSSSSPSSIFPPCKKAKFSREQPKRFTFSDQDIERDKEREKAKQQQRQKISWLPENFSLESLNSLSTVQTDIEIIDIQLRLVNLLQVVMKYKNSDEIKEATDYVGTIGIKLLESLKVHQNNIIKDKATKILSLLNPELSNIEDLADNQKQDKSVYLNSIIR